MTLFAEPPSDKTFWKVVDDTEVHLVSALVAPWTANALCTVPPWAIGYKEVNSQIIMLTSKVMSTLREACACFLAEAGVSKAMSEFHTDDPIQWSGMLIDALKRGHLGSRWVDDPSFTGLVVTWMQGDFMLIPAARWKDSTQMTDPETGKLVGMLDLGLEIRVHPHMSEAITAARQAREDR